MRLSRRALLERSAAAAAVGLSFVGPAEPAEPGPRRASGPFAPSSPLQPLSAQEWKPVTTLKNS